MFIITKRGINERKRNNTSFGFTVVGLAVGKGWNNTQCPVSHKTKGIILYIDREKEERICDDMLLLKYFYDI